ncbi:hypothetical protein NM04_11475 [Massilia aurea]|uniref:Uncharacterized protein n=1 Tax=Massilia aurea TaxID=373040 RepID=A0A422QKU5_9BURK|nr:hypothetical protein [Massilia aurea]RNF30620.1 hypothetical protein NM04_11475 [Massilia aurea]
MNDPTPSIDPKNKGRAMYDEADIGSGERSPGQHETDEMIRGIPPLPSNRQADEGTPNSGKEDNEGGGTPEGNRQGTPGV